VPRDAWHGGRIIPYIAPSNKELFNEEHDFSGEPIHCYLPALNNVRELIPKQQFSEQNNVQI